MRNNFYIYLHIFLSCQSSRFHVDPISHLILSSFYQRISLSICYHGSLLAINYFRLYLSENVFILLSILNDIFMGQAFQVISFFSFSFLNIELHLNFAYLVSENLLSSVYFSVLNLSLFSSLYALILFYLWFSGSSLISVISRPVSVDRYVLGHIFVTLFSSEFFLDDRCCKFFIIDFCLPLNHFNCVKFCSGTEVSYLKSTKYFFKVSFSNLLR